MRTPTHTLLLFMAAALVVYFRDCEGAQGNAAVYVEIKLSLTWSEICNLEKYIKINFAKELLRDGDGSQVSPDQIKIFNFADHCPSGSDMFKEATLKFCVSKEMGKMTVVDEIMTKKAYKVLHYYYENGLEGYLGSIFRGKIKGVEIKGKKAPATSTAYTEVERLYVGMGVGLAVIVVVILISLFVMCCCKKDDEDKETKTKSYIPGYGHEVKTAEPESSLELTPVTTPSDNQGFNGDQPSNAQVHVGTPKLSTKL